MKELHTVRAFRRKGVANRPDPESRNVRAACGARREAGCEALAGVHGTRNARSACVPQAGWVWSSEKGIPERRRSPVLRKAMSKQRTESLARDSGRLCGVVDPKHAERTFRAWTLNAARTFRGCETHAVRAFRVPWEPGDPGGARDARNRGPEGKGDER